MSKLTKSAMGQECQIRIEGVCNGNSDTTVLCHLAGGGMGGKVADIHAAYGCSACHDEIDRRTRHLDNDTADLYHHHGVVRTQQIMMDQGLLTHAGVPRIRRAG